MKLPKGYQIPFNSRYLVPIIMEYDFANRILPFFMSVGLNTPNKITIFNSFFRLFIIFVLYYWHKYLLVTILLVSFSFLLI